MAPARVARLAVLICAALSCRCMDQERYLGAVHVEAQELGAFGTPQLIAELAAPDRDQYDATLSPDLLTIFYRSEPRQTPGSGRSEIVMATRPSVDAPWSAATLVSELDAPEAWNLAPDFSRDGLTLWFSSDRAWGAGGLDLWVSHRASSTDSWGAPVNVGGVNSALWDTDGSVSPDQLELVFSRQDANADLLVSRRATPDAEWSAPVPVTELNTAAAEWDAVFALDGDLLFFTSNHSERADLDGSLHIFESRRAARDQPFEAPRLVSELAAPGAIDEDPWLSNDARFLVFSSTRDGRRHLYSASR